MPRTRRQRSTRAVPDVTAVYSGDSNFNSSTSSDLSQTVNAADTTTTLSSSSNTSVFGQSATFSVSVSGTTATPTGSVVFYDGSTALDTETLDGSGNASFATSALAVGSHTITAVYGGDSNYNSSTSSAVDQAVDFATSTTMASSEPNPSVFGQSVTFTAGVSAVSPGSGIPTGSIVFYDGSTAFGHRDPEWLRRCCVYYFGPDWRIAHHHGCLSG